MRYALIKNNKVENVIIADEDFIKHLDAKYDYIESVDNIRVGPGCSYDPVKKVFGNLPPPSLPSLGELKSTKLTQLESIFQEKAKEPIFDTNNNCSWSGGSESAMLIDGAIRLAQQKATSNTDSTSVVTINLYDSSTEIHTLSIADAQKVSILVAGAFQTLYAKKAAIAKAIKDAATVVDMNNISITL